MSAEARNNLNRTESYSYPHEHIGHLIPEHIAALEKFKEISKSKGYYHPAGTNGSDRASHDDETLLRYLRARKWIPSEAFGQFSETEDWRKENKIEQLYDTIDVEDYDQARRLYPQWTGRRDKRGIPTYVFEVAHLNSKNISAYESSTSKPAVATGKVPVKMLRLFALYENLTDFALPLCSEIPDRMYPETPVSQSSNIVDISNVGLKQFWNLKSHMQDASTLATARYPETLDRIFIIGAPSFFPTVWGWIKRWFDPITVSKIFILSKQNMKSTLEEFMDVEDIPKKYGGKLDYEFGQMPNIDPKIDQCLTWINPTKQNGKNTIPTGPIRWKKSNNGEMVAVAVGSVGGKPRDTPVASLRTQPTTTQASREGGLRPTPVLVRQESRAEDTHPPSPPAEDVDIPTPPSDTDIPATGHPSDDHSRNATMSIPYRPTNETSLEPTRQGTSATRYEQQSATHGDGQLKYQTPILRSSGDGDKHAIMEPSTVSQAPKEHPVPEPAAPAPSYFEQAQGVASSAYATAAGAAGAAMKAVGLTKEGEQTEESAEQQTSKIPEDPAVDKAKENNVEEFLRSQYPSKASEKAQQMDL